MDTKAPVADPTFTGTVTGPTINASTALQIGGTAITATAAELNKMDGATVSASDINSAVTSKAPTADPTFTGTLAAPTINASTKLQVNGTDVITNARARVTLQHKSTTAAAIGAGGVGGGGLIELTASGSITAGDLVGITPSGSVSKLIAKVKKNNVELNIGRKSQSYRDLNILAVIKLLWRIYRIVSTLIAKVGTISGDTISFGSECDVNRFRHWWCILCVCCL